MKIFYFSLFLLIGCASSKAPLAKYQYMDDLWKKRATREEIIKQFGQPNELVENGITYRESPNRITSAHFFNKDNTLKSQLAFVTANELKELKDKFPCSWEKWTEIQQRSHYLRTIELGKCSAKNINYREWDSMKLYEVRWEN